MMRTMRANAKYVFYILSISFVGWLAYGQVTDILGPGANVVLRVNGREIQVPEYQQAVQAALEQYRQQTGTGPLTREDEQAIQDQVVEQLIRDILLQQEYERLGIRVTAEEIRAAARTSPLPELVNNPTFQTDGRFDPAKYQRYLATADAAFLQALEARYRQQIPLEKFAQYLTADVYVSDAKLWRIYRDQRDSARITLVAIGPEAIPDSLAPLTSAELERYYREHRDDFKQPAVAYLSYVALDRRPDAADTAVALARARALRAEAAASRAKFEEVAQRASADSASGQQGGDLGWFKRDQPGFDADFLAAVRRLGPGQVSSPVLTQFGIHVIRVDAARGDSVRARHILVPIELVGEHLDRVEARADSLDRLAAEQTDPGVLDSGAARLGLTVERARLAEGGRLALDGAPVPDVSVWAFEAEDGETSPVVEGRPAFYVFRLDSLVPARTPPLAEVRPAVLQAARRERKHALAGRRAGELMPSLAAGPSLAAAAARAGLEARTYGPFTRVAPPPPLVREPLVLGVAFGLRVGERAGPLAGEHGHYFVELVGRRLADSSAWLAQRDRQREQMLPSARDARISGYLAALRLQADVVDRRKELYRTPAQAPAGPLLF